MFPLPSCGGFVRDDRIIRRGRIEAPPKTPGKWLFIGKSGSAPAKRDSTLSEEYGTLARYHETDGSHFHRHFGKLHQKRGA
jgi:hypothetical protein